MIMLYEVVKETEKEQEQEQQEKSLPYQLLSSILIPICVPAQRHVVYHFHAVQRSSHSQHHGNLQDLEPVVCREQSLVANVVVGTFYDL